VIGPFDLRHIGLVYGLQDATTALDLKAGLVETPSPLRSALRSYLPTGAMRTYTYVLQAPSNGHPLRGFVQACPRQSEIAWKVTCIAPNLNTSDQAATVWYRLLLHLCIAAGERRVQRLFACLPDDHPAEEVLRQAGFASYARQRLLARSAALPITARPSRAAKPLRPEDAVGVTSLFHKLTPRLVQQTAELQEWPAEVPMQDAMLKSSAQAYVWQDHQGDLSGYLYLDVGPRGVWARVIVRPDQRHQALEMVEHALSLAASYTPRPVYCTVREYESGVEHALEQSGFEASGTYRLWVKHTAVQVKAVPHKFVQTFENRAGVAPTVSHCGPS
jgi:hypothetical protein